MIDNNPFLSFVDFVESDHLLDVTIQKKAVLSQEIDYFQHMIADEEAKVRTLRKRVHDLKKEVDIQDLEVRALRTQEKEKQNKLTFITAPREYLSLQHELEILSQKIDRYEDNLMKRWQQLEDEELLLRQEVERSTQEQQRVSFVLQDKEKKLQDINSTIDTIITQRDAKEQCITEEWREIYHAMKERVPNPAVPVVEGACSACFYHVSPNDLALLRRHKILQCKDCYRLLYVV